MDPADTRRELRWQLARTIFANGSEMHEKMWDQVPEFGVPNSHDGVGRLSRERYLELADAVIPLVEQVWDVAYEQGRKDEHWGDSTKNPYRKAN